MSQPPLHTSPAARVFFGVCFLVLLLAAGTVSGGASKARPARTTAAAAQFNLVGKFDPPINFPPDAPVMVHASLLPDGRVLFWGRDKETDALGAPTIRDVVFKSSARIWNPATNGFEHVDNTTTNLFCSGHSLLPDGRLFVAGGHKHWHPYSASGDEQTNIFDPAEKKWTSGPRMEKGRWYPFTLTLDTGEVAIVSGTYESGPAPQPTAAPPYQKQQKQELYDPKTNSLELLDEPATAEIQNYPYLFLDPVAGTGPGTPNAHRGVFSAGPRHSMFWNPRGGVSGKGSWSVATPHAHRHFDGSAVMYDSEEGKILLTGGRASSTGATYDVAKKITLNQANPQWVTLERPMLHPRTFHTSTLLPDGKVLVTGGVPCQGGHTLEPCTIINEPNDVNRTKQAELWDPATEVWTALATGANTRTYHSTALLLPDARVLVGGGGLPDGLRYTDQGNGLSLRRHTAGERNMEIYSPPYLFDAAGNLAPRPVITSVAHKVAYGQQFGLTYGNAGSVSRVAWVRLPSVTHGFNTDQRINVLHFTPTPGTANQLTVTAPGNPRKCPPGYYMLFIFNEGGKPSVAKMVSIGAIDQESHVGRRSVLSNGKVHLFYRHLNDRTLRFMTQAGVDGDTFTAPVDLGGGLNSNPLAIHNADGRLEVFVLGFDNRLYSNRQAAAGGDAWAGWQFIGPYSSLPAFAVARNLDGRLQVFYRDEQNAISYVVQTAASGANWAAPVSLGGALTSEPAVGINADGRLQLFARGVDNALYHNWQISPGGANWAGWYRLGGALSSGPFVAYQRDGRLDVFARGADNAVLHVAQAAPNGVLNWSAFESLGGSVRADHAYATPVATLTPDGRLQLFVRWADDTVRTMVQNTPNGSFPAGNWGNLWGAINATLPPPTRSNDGRLFLFARGAAANLYFNRQTAPGSGPSWAGYVYLGDAAHSF